MSGNIRRRATVSAIAALGMAGVVAASADAQAQQQSKQNDFRIRAPQLSQSSGTEKPSGQMKKSQSARSSQDVQAVQQALKQEGHDLKVDGIMGPQTREALRKYRSEEHTSELQSLMRISYAVFCLKKKKKNKHSKNILRTNII